MIVIDQWSGLVTNASPYALPVTAAATQVNIQVLSPGQLTVRPADVSVSWATATANAAPIATAVRFQHGTPETVVYQDVSGVIFVAKNPT